jgi:tetratricopeptide (TPR) repeat protein
MRNKIIILFLAILPLVLVAVAEDAERDFSSHLTKADELKHAEKYEEAEKVYEEILKIAPDHLEALKGKDDCWIMLHPPLPMQHLVPPVFDEEYEKLLKRKDEANTPWDRRRAEFMIECYGMKHTGRIFVKDKKELEEKAGKLIEKAVPRIQAGENAENVYLETAEELKSLQVEAHCSWKGHGPDILEPSLEELDKIYKDKGFSNPTRPLALSARTLPEVTAEGEMAELTLTITNKSSTPVILLDLWLAGLKHNTFSWQKPMHGSLNYDKEKDLFYYNALAQQETYGVFNLGLLFPGHTAGFQKKVRIPKPICEAYVRFAVLDDETIKYVYTEGKDNIYSPASLKELSSRTRDKVMITEDPLFPGEGAIIFDDTQAYIWNQSFTLDLGRK